jgi:hypothetical protein
MQTTLGLLATAVFLLCAGCGGAQSAGSQRGDGPDCEVRHDGVCYATLEEACAAAGCPSEHCAALETSPMQIRCDAAGGEGESHPPGACETAGGACGETACADSGQREVGSTCYLNGEPQR